MSAFPWLSYKGPWLKKNVFEDLMDRVVKSPCPQFPGKWRYYCYVPRIYSTLTMILKKIELEEFDCFITDYINFVKKTTSLLLKDMSHEFTEICTNTILYWIFARKGNPELVELLMKKTKEYWQDKNNSLALILRCLFIQDVHWLLAGAPFFSSAQSKWEWQRSVKWVTKFPSLFSVQMLHNTSGAFTDYQYKPNLSQNVAKLTNVWTYVLHVNNSRSKFNFTVPAKSYGAMSGFLSLDYQLPWFKKNVFIDLMDKVVSGPSLQFPGQWGYQSYEPRVYTTLAAVLRKIELQEFDSFITDFIKFVNRQESMFRKDMSHEFTEICTNTILYWIFARKGNPDLVELLLKKTKHYWKDKNNSLALILRTFTPVYCPSPPAGITPLLYVAQTRQSNILKILLQYGILERENNPGDIVFKIVFYPSRMRIMDDHKCVDIQEDAKICLELCTRVLARIPVTEFLKQQHFGRHPIIFNWLDYIPQARYEGTCELLHLCRMAIRRQLLTNNMLPEGIFLLPLPVILQHYLNLNM